MPTVPSIPINTTKASIQYRYLGRLKAAPVYSEYLPAHLETAPGDTVWTSGFSGIFPPDIPLGITGESRLVDGAVKEMKVELFLDFGALRHVTVVENLDREEIRRLEGGATE